MFLEGKTLELMIAAIVALVVVGPKDLPILLRKFGQFMARLRGMAAEFRASFDEMARQSELDELRKEVDALRRGQIADQAAQAAGLAETNALADEIHSSLSDVGVQLHPPMSYQYSQGATEPPPVTMEAAAPEPKPKKKPAAKKAPARATSAKKSPAKTPAAARKAPSKKASS